MPEQSKKKRITVVGGGTGSYTVLKGLKKYDLELAAIVTMFDSGGSTGLLIDELGVLPPGDIRRCLLALADESGENTLRELFEYRFEGGVSEHSLGNLILAAAEKRYGNLALGIGKLSKILRLKGRVYPVSLSQSQLCAALADGTIITGETNIDRPVGERAAINHIFLKPAAPVYEKAQEALLDSDLIVIGPGDLYTSVIPNLLVEGVSQAICDSPAKVVYVCNLMTKHGETDGYTASRFLQEIEKYLGKKVDYFICNKNGLDPQLLQKYQQEKQFPVVVDLDPKTEPRLILTDLAYQPNLIRHHRDKIAEVLVNLAAHL